MYLFPYDTITTSTDQAGSTLTGTLLPSVGYDRQMVYCHITCSSGDCHMSLGVTTTTPEMQLCDTEGASVIDNFSPIVITSGTPVVWDKPNAGVRANFHLSFVPYRLASTTDITTKYRQMDYLTIFSLIAVVILFFQLVRIIFNVDNR